MRLLGRLFCPKLICISAIPKLPSRLSKFANKETGVELLEMTARGVHGELRFGTTAMMSGVRGASAESGGLLKFEVKEKHLKDCYRKFCSINIA